MKKRLFALALTIMMLSLMIAPTIASAVTWTAYVAPANGKTLNLRTRPDKDAPIILRIPYAASVTILNKYGSVWMEVNYKGSVGFVMQRYLSYSKPANKPTPKPAPAPEASLSSLYKGFTRTSYFVTLRPTVPGGFGHMRWAPTTKATIIRDFYQDDVLEVIAQNNTWAQVRDPNSGTTGFMSLAILTSVGYYGGQENTAAK